MKHLKAYIPVFSVFSLALLIRVVYNLTIGRNYIPGYDAAIYNNLAQELLKWHCYCRFNSHQPTTFRSPLWPFIIAGIYSVLGENNLYPRLFYSVLSSGTCVLVYLLAKDLFGKRVALASGVIAALYPGMFIWDGWLYSEALFTFCLTALIYAFARIQSSIQASMSLGKQAWVSWPWLIVGGILLGLTLLARPSGMVFIGILCLWAVLLLFARTLPWQATLKSVLVVIAIAAVINIPWVYRNYTVTHSLTPISTVGTTLDGAYRDCAVATGGMWGCARSSISIDYAKFCPQNVISINPDFCPYTVADEKLDTNEALSWMRTHLSSMLTLFSLHLLNFWTPYRYSFGLPFEKTAEMTRVRPETYIMPVIITFATIPVFLLAALGLVVTWTRKRKYLLMGYLMIALLALQSIIFYGSPRFRAPIEPVLVLLVGGAIWWLFCNEPGTLRHWWFGRSGARQVAEGITPETVGESVDVSPR